MCNDGTVCRVDSSDWWDILPVRLLFTSYLAGMCAILQSWLSRLVIHFTRESVGMCKNGTVSRADSWDRWDILLVSLLCTGYLAGMCKNYYRYRADFGDFSDILLVGLWVCALTAQSDWRADCWERDIVFISLGICAMVVAWRAYFLDILPIWLWLDTSTVAWL